jgi:hypothetical protein
MKNAKAVYEILERAAIEVAELGGNKLAETLRSEMDNIWFNHMTDADRIAINREAGNCAKKRRF